MTSIYTQDNLQKIMSFYTQTHRVRVNRILLLELLRQLESADPEDLTVLERESLLKVCAYLKYMIQVDFNSNLNLIEHTISKLEDIFKCTNLLQALAEYETTYDLKIN